jgi:hypothetical protein
LALSGVEGALSSPSRSLFLYSAPAPPFSVSVHAVAEQREGNLLASPPLSKRATTRGAGGSSSRGFRAFPCSPLPTNSWSPRSPPSVTVTVVWPSVGWVRFARKVSRLGVGRGPSRIRAGARDPRHSASSSQGPRAAPKVCARSWFACRACSRSATRRAGSGTFSAQNSSNARRSFSLASASAVAKRSTSCDNR